MDDQRVGRLIRALRRRRGWRQVDLAGAADSSQSLVSLVERGHLDQVAMGRLRRLLAALDARGEVEVRWRGGAVDRLVDERHATLVGAIVGDLRRVGWSVEIEVTYARYGERGAIDVLAFHRETNALLVVEVKSELASLEATLRRLDEKARLGPVVASERFGWAARSASRLLVLPETTTSRDRLAAHAAILDSSFPLRGVEVRRWLRRPEGRVAAIRLLRPANGSGITRRGGGAYRIRPPASSSGRAKGPGRGQLPGVRSGRYRA